MPLQIQQLGSVVMFRYLGTVTPADLVQSAAQAQSLEQSSAMPVDRIADLTAVIRFDINFDSVYDLAARRKAQCASDRFYVAIIATKPIQIGFARMYQSLYDNPAAELSIVSSVEEAIGWIQKSRA